MENAYFSYNEMIAIGKKNAIEALRDHLNEMIKPVKGLTDFPPVSAKSSNRNANNKDAYLFIVLPFVCACDYVAQPHVDAYTICIRVHVDYEYIFLCYPS